MLATFHRLQRPRQKTQPNSPTSVPRTPPDKVKAEQHLASFIKQAWQVLEPATELVWGWHIEALCLHLEAVLRGDIRNLYAALPPGSTKSLTVNVLFVAWAWIHQPSLRFLCAANEKSLAIRDSLACRRLIESEWYQQRWGSVYQLTSDQNVKSWYENSARGHRQCVTVASKVTGKKGDIILLDDPHSTKEVESVVKRKAVIDWWKQECFNRVTNAKTGRRIMIGQRTHYEDLPGLAVKQQGFQEFRVPEEFEPENKCVTYVGGKVFWEDPRTQPGELLRPERFGPAEIHEAKHKTLGPNGYAAQHQQRPLPAEGALFKKDWFRTYQDLGDGFRVVATGELLKWEWCWTFIIIDPAKSKKKTADFTAMGVFTVTPKRQIVIRDYFSERVGYENIIAELDRLCARWRPLWVGIESDGFQVMLVKEAREVVVGPGGSSRKRYPHIPTVEELETQGKGKVVRAQPAIMWMRNGDILFPEPEEHYPWVEGLKEELMQFTGEDGIRDDRVDCLTWAVLRLDQIHDHAGYDDGPMILGSPPNPYSGQGESAQDIRARLRGAA